MTLKSATILPITGQRKWFTFNNRNISIRIDEVPVARFLRDRQVVGRDEAPLLRALGGPIEVGMESALLHRG